MTWRVSRLWKEEIPAYRPILRRVRLALLGRWEQGHGGGGYWNELGGALQEAVCEFFAAFHYTIGHVVTYVLIGWLFWLIAERMIA